MAEGGENPTVDLKTFSPDKDVEFTIEMLRATLGDIVLYFFNIYNFSCALPLQM